MTPLENYQQDLIKGLKQPLLVELNSKDLISFTENGNGSIDDGGKIAFNSRYLLDFLNAVKFDLGADSKEKEKIVQLEISGALKPGLFKIKGDKEFLHVIMPVRLQK